MNLAYLTSILIVTAEVMAAVAAEATSHLHLRVVVTDGQDDCLIPKQSQCDGENWTKSKCCKDKDHECRWDDVGASVKKCQPVRAPRGNTSESKPILTALADWTSPDEDGGEDSEKEDRFVGLFEDCTDEFVQCEGSNECVTMNRFYRRCMPPVLAADELCGQNDGVNFWKYDKCAEGLACMATGASNEQHCLKVKHDLPHREKFWPTFWPTLHPDKPQQMDLWQECMKPHQVCKPGSVCVKYSEYYSQCKPFILPPGELCGQHDGTNDWKFDHCTKPQKCLPVGSDFRCK